MSLFKNKVSNWIGLHHWSTWMILFSLILMGISVHPALISYIQVLFNATWMFLTREVVRAEDVSNPGIHWKTVVACVLAIVVLLYFTMHINWFAT